MKLKKAYRYFQLGSLVVMTTYLFVVVTHLIIVPQFNESHNSGKTSVQKNTEFLYYLVRTDRSTFNDTKIKASKKLKTAFNIFSVVIPKVSYTGCNGKKSLNQFSSAQNQTYLTFCALRI